MASAHEPAQYAETESRKTGLFAAIEAAKDGRVSNEYVGILFRRWVDTLARRTELFDGGDA